MNDNILIVIPARKGSSFYRKNIQLVSGKPLVRYTLEASQINQPHKTLITTDDPYIIEESLPYNAIIDERPANLADEYATLDQVMFYTAVNYANYGIYCCLPPTSPLRNKFHVEEAINKFLHSRCDSLISVKEERRSVWIDNADGFIKPLIEQTKNRQQARISYISNGAIFISKRELIIKNKKKASGMILPYIMTEEASIDIHDENDIKLAEYLMGVSA